MNELAYGMFTLPTPFKFLLVGNRDKVSRFVLSILCHIMMNIVAQVTLNSIDAGYMYGFNDIANDPKNILSGRKQSNTFLSYVS
jgi:hypothetical protein